MIAKIISIFAKIVIARKISTLAMSVYSLTLPTLSLLLNIAQLGIPTTISKLIAKRKYPTFKIMQVSIIVMLLIDLIVGIIYVFFVPSLAHEYLKNPHTLLTLYGMVLLLPLISLTSILKGYFIGIDKVDTTAKCQISEEISRLLFVFLLVDFINKNNFSLLSFFTLFSSIVGEIASLIHLCINLNFKNFKKRVVLHNESNKKIIFHIMKFSLMSTSTKLFGSLIYFFEPILFTYLMQKANVPLDELTLQYGIINSYVLPLILLPSFFSNCIAIFILPKLSFNIERNNFLIAKKLFLQVIAYSITIGFICISFIYFFPEMITKILYGKIIGIYYIKRYSFFLCICFLQAPFHMALISFDKEKLLLFESIICNLIKIVCFFAFIPLYKTDGLLISILISLYTSIFIHIISLSKCFISFKNKGKFVINK